jgi:uncharacterized membrane protein
VPADRGTLHPRQSLGTGRLVGFRGGVFSIAATLLVLDLAVHPPRCSPGLLRRS